MAEKGSSGSATKGKMTIGALLAWVFFAVLVVSAILSMLELQVVWIFFGIASIILVIIPVIKEHDPSKIAPAWIILLMSLAFLLHWTQGDYAVVDMGNEFLATAGVLDAILLGSLAFIIVRDLEMYTDLEMNKPVAAMFVILFTMAVTGIALVVVWLADVMYAWPEKLAEESDSLGTNGDVMNFICYAALGGVVMGIVYSLYTWVLEKRELGSAKEVAA